MPDIDELRRQYAIEPDLIKKRRLGEALEKADPTFRLPRPRPFPLQAQDAFRKEDVSGVTVSIQEGPRFVESAKVPLSSLKFHTPKKSGDRPWRIVRLDTGAVVDSYTPSKPKKDKPDTPYAGSWAEQEEQRRSERDETKAAPALFRKAGVTLDDEVSRWANALQNGVINQERFDAIVEGVKQEDAGIQEHLKRLGEEKARWMRLLSRGSVNQERYDAIMDGIERIEQEYKRKALSAKAARSPFRKADDGIPESTYNAIRDAAKELWPQGGTFDDVEMSAYEAADFPFDPDDGEAHDKEEQAMSDAASAGIQEACAETASKYGLTVDKYSAGWWGFASGKAAVWMSDSATFVARTETGETKNFRASAKGFEKACQFVTASQAKAAPAPFRKAGVTRYPTTKKPTDPTYNAQWSGVTGAPKCPKGCTCPDCGGALHIEGDSHYCPSCDDYKPAPNHRL